jgi:hypothetical protein
MSISFAETANLQYPQRGQHFSTEVWLIVAATKPLILLRRCRTLNSDVVGIYWRSALGVLLNDRTSSMNRR